MAENKTGKILAIAGGTGVLGGLLYWLFKKKEPAPPAPPTKARIEIKETEASPETVRPGDEVTVYASFENTGGTDWAGYWNFASIGVVGKDTFISLDAGEYKKVSQTFTVPDFEPGWYSITIGIGEETLEDFPERIKIEEIILTSEILTVEVS